MLLIAAPPSVSEARIAPLLFTAGIAITFKTGGGQVRFPLDGGCMKRIFGSVTVSLALIFLFLSGCGGQNLNVERIHNLLEDQSILIQKYIDGIKTAGRLEDVTDRMDEYLQGIKRLTPDLNLHLAIARKTGDHLNEAQLSALSRMVSVLRLMENLVQMDLKRFGSHSRINEIREQLIAAYREIDVTGLPVDDERIRLAYNELLEGRIQGDGALANLSRQMGRASLTSKLKITMRIMMDLSRALNRYIKEYGFAPKVKSLEDLHLYPRFIPYFKDLILKDAWGNFFHYQVDGAVFRIASAGSDGEFQGFEQEGAYRDLSGRDVILSGERFVLWPDFRRR